jgi:hypothetical protein
VKISACGPSEPLFTLAIAGICAITSHAMDAAGAPVIAVVANQVWQRVAAKTVATLYADLEIPE